MGKLLSERSWELSVLCRAIAYPNLSAAATHVGLSQPQLSRIIARLEADLEITLLDRTVRRKSGWTPLAERLADTFLKSAHQMESEVQTLIGNAQPSSIAIGTLEGLMPIAAKFANNLFKTEGAKVVELNVHDLNQLEELFLKSELDLIFTLREPGRRKFRHVRHIGNQWMERCDRPGNFAVMSSYEFNSGVEHAPENTPILISNSLAVRKLWLDEYGGKGVLPSEVKKAKKSASQTANDRGVYLVGDDLLPENVWKKITAIQI